MINIIRNKVLGFILILISVVLTSCLTAPATSPATNRWLSFSIEPSRVRNSMATGADTLIMWHRLGDGTRMDVFFDRNLSFDDAIFFYHRLMHDFGWHRSRDGHWESAAPGSARFPSRGTMYVNPARRMAVYFYPGGNYESFRVRFIQ